MGHVTYFWNFGTPSISRVERLELETINLACRFITSGTNEINEKLDQRGSGRGHGTYFWHFGTPSISREERFELETSNLACRFSTSGTNERNAKLGQRASAVVKVTADSRGGAKFKNTTLHKWIKQIRVIGRLEGPHLLRPYFLPNRL